MIKFVLTRAPAMFILYTVAPLLYRMASSAYYNLSLLSADFYGLLFGLFLYVRPLPPSPPLYMNADVVVVGQHYKPYWLYFVAFAVILVGLVVYFWSATRTYFFFYFLLLWDDS